MLFRENQRRLLLNAPAVALGYAALALALASVGCEPPFLDTEVFGVRATSFLLLALTASAALLIVFAALNPWRTLRALRRRGRRDARENAALAGVVLAAAALVFTAWLGIALLRMPCT